MKARNAARALCLVAISCLGVLARPQTISNPFAGNDPIEYSNAVSARDRLLALPDTNSAKANYIFLFSSLASRRTSMRSETDPMFVGIWRLRDRHVAWDKDARAYDVDKKRYEDDAAAYVAAGGEGSYRTDDPKYAMFIAWHGRLVAWKGRLVEWVNRVNTEANEIKALYSSFNQTLADHFAKWRQACADYVVSVDRIMKRAEIEKKLEEVRAKIKLDRRELAQYSQLPGIYADIEKMALDADEAREEGAIAALDEMTGMALDKLTEKVTARAKLAKGQLAEIQRILKKYNVRDVDVGLVLKNHKGVTVTREAELLDQLGKFKNVASAYDSTTKKQYALALASLLETFVEYPPFKLAITNFKVYSSLFYTGTSYVLTRARVNQYGKLSEQQLVAVSKISELYKKHLKEEKKLRDELAAMG